MELDFTRLNSIGDRETIAQAGEKTPSERPAETAGNTPEHEVKQGDRAALKAKNEATERAAAAYKKYQQNILAAGQLRSEITGGAAAGEDIYTLFLKAVETIGKMTGDSLFIDQIGKSIKSVYGIGLKEEQPLNLEILETRARLKKLKTAWKRETDLESRDRIGRAIDAHEARIKKLERMAASAKERPA